MMRLPSSDVWYLTYASSPGLPVATHALPVVSTTRSADPEQSAEPSRVIDLLIAPALRLGSVVLKLITSELKNPALSASPIVEHVAVSEKVCSALPEQSAEA
jgi:hypothetical protein